MSSIKLGEIIKIQAKYCRGHYDFYKVVKVSPKTVKVAGITRNRRQLECDAGGGNFYGLYEFYADEKDEDLGSVRSLKIKDIEDDMRNSLSYTCRIDP